MQKAFHTLHYGDDTNTDQLKIKLTLTPPHLKHLKLGVMVIVEAAGAEMIWDEDGEARVQHVIHLTFADLCWTQQKSRPRMKQSCGSSERAQAAVSL
jgi:hypothetical protein